MTMDARSRRLRRVSRAVAVALCVSALGAGSVGLAASPASAGLLSTVAGVLPSCAARPTSTPFAPWGDTSTYFAMPGGGFESGAAGWTVAGGAKVVAGNEPWYVSRSTSDTHSLAIPSNARATAPTVCVSMGDNTVRFFVKNSGVASSVLHVEAYVQNPLTGLVLATGFDIKGGATTGWSPSPAMLIPNLLGGVLGTQNLTLVFTTSGTPATWNIDDVFVDPFKSR